MISASEESAILKIHMQRYINTGYDIERDSDKKAAINSYGGVKGHQAADVKVQETRPSIRKHTVNVIQTKNIFCWESGGLQVRKAHESGP